MKSLQSLISKQLCLGLGLWLITTLDLRAQGNCAAYSEGSPEQVACEYGHKAIQYKQGSRTSQVYFDSALMVSPDYAWAYFEKSIPYLKRGYLTHGMSLLNRAVELSPEDYLCYRAYWFFQHQSYASAILDLEHYYGLDGAYQQNTPGGALDMRIVLGLAYAGQGDYVKAIAQVNQVIASYPSNDYAGPYDFHTLGVLYLKNEQYAEAKAALLKSTVRNEQFADTYYYLAIIADTEGQLKAAKNYLSEAIIRYDGGKDGYSGYPFCFPVSKERVQLMLKELENN